MGTEFAQFHTATVIAGSIGRTLIIPLSHQLKLSRVQRLAMTKYLRKIDGVREVHFNDTYVRVIFIGNRMYTRALYRIVTDLLLLAEAVPANAFDGLPVEIRTVNPTAGVLTEMAALVA